MTPGTSRYDSADYLDSEVAIVATLKLAFEEGDAADIRTSLNNAERVKVMTKIFQPRL